MQEFKKKYGSGNTTLIISNKDMNYIMKIILGNFNILLKGVTKTIKKLNKGTKRGILKYVIRYFRC